MKKNSVIFIILIIVYFFIEFSIYFFVANSKFKILFYSKKTLSEKDYNHLVKKRDEILGWPIRNDNFNISGFIPRSKSKFENYFKTEEIKI